ncbi:glutathione S-transferase N-terminal domain-containing protein [Pseudomonas orientalis]|jgi:glutathione S-transferase|uniref:Glutathione S-transferase n=1 Tax=Pseudomonas orientalis TaxID=76758 RepID=A0A4Q7D3N7_9PSED|nr:glutathione S-transferase N-terminal domain-containing protein [Pseudomonas orientalis]RZI32558.1 glutathione S-transferase [Pseudomonas orientalis]
MILYYAPAACSQASHIALIAAGLPHRLIKVGRDKRTEDGTDFTLINGKGYTPAFDVGDGTILTESLAILLYIADKSGKLLAKSGLERWRAIENLAFMSSEIHKGFTPYFKGGTTLEKEDAAKTLHMRFETIAAQLRDRLFLTSDKLSVDDCYLFVMLSWAELMGVAVPSILVSYRKRLRDESSVKLALNIEGVE